MNITFKQFKPKEQNETKDKRLGKISQHFPLRSIQCYNEGIAVLMFWFHLADKMDQLTSTGVAYWKVIILILTALSPSRF